MDLIHIVGKKVRSALLDCLEKSAERNVVAKKVIMIDQPVENVLNGQPIVCRYREKDALIRFIKCLGKVRESCPDGRDIRP